MDEHSAVDLATYRTTHRSTGRLARLVRERLLEGDCQVHPSLRQNILDAASDAAVTYAEEGDTYNFEDFLVFCERRVAAPNTCDRAGDMGRPDFACHVRSALSYLLDPCEPGTFIDAQIKNEVATRTGTLRMDIIIPIAEHRAHRLSLFFFWEDGEYWVEAIRTD